MSSIFCLDMVVVRKIPVPARDQTPIIQPVTYHFTDYKSIFSLNFMNYPPD
jgi:hypothetical protein